MLFTMYTNSFRSTTILSLEMVGVLGGVGGCGGGVVDVCVTVWNGITEGRYPSCELLSMFFAECVIGFNSFFSSHIF